MPHSNSENEQSRQRRRYPNRLYVCPMCSQSHESFGQTQRKSIVCAPCYPLYRRADLILASIKYRCKKFDLPYDLDVRWLFEKLQQPCCRTGLPFNLDAITPTMKDRAFDGPSVDKIDPDGGYLKDNCQVVIWWYNCMKQRFSDEKVRELCQLVINKNVFFPV